MPTRPVCTTEPIRRSLASLTNSAARSSPDTDPDIDSGCYRCILGCSKQKPRRRPGLLVAGSSWTHSRALRRFDGHHIVFMAGMPLQVIAAHADLVADEFIAELERIQDVA